MFFSKLKLKKIIKRLGTVSPDKTIPIYTRAAMDLRNSSEYLGKILS